MMCHFFIIILFFISVSSYCEDICSRVAVINFQEVLVDTGNNQKGEGLRYYLEKDELAKSYLDTYQKGTQIKWQNTLTGSVGLGFLVGGLLSTNKKTKKSLLIGSAVLVFANVVIAKSLEYSNEGNLLRAVEEYNKRNIPKIHLLSGRERELSSSNSLSFMLQKSWPF